MNHYQNCHSEARQRARAICSFAGSSRFLAGKTGCGMTIIHRFQRTAHDWTLPAFINLKRTVEAQQNR